MARLLLAISTLLLFAPVAAPAPPTHPARLPLAG
jgi:hypothetical protein